MYTRGQFAVMGNIGRKALRLYHEEGLLVPVFTNKDEASGIMVGA
jgi:DNA-binding transcriptional MerR regulator